MAAKSMVLYWLQCTASPDAQPCHEEKDMVYLGELVKGAPIKFFFGWIYLQ